jgi:AcrR family transcriptional regulator
MSTVGTETARDRVLRAAGALFYEHGFQAVGVDLIIEHAGVAKATLYRHFATKDELIAEYLRDANATFREWFDSSIDTGAPATDALVGLFDAVAELATSPGCLGCTFQMAASEFPDMSHPGHAVALAHKQAVRARLRELAYKAGAHQPDELADSLLLLMDGAFASARMFRHDSPSSRVGHAAHTLIDTHTRHAGQQADPAL